MTNQEIVKIADEIIHGRRLNKDDDLSFLLKADINVIGKQANRIREALCERHIDLCAIVNGKSGRCSEDCKFCAQSSRSNTGIEEYSFLDEETIIAQGHEYAKNQVHRYSIVTAGRTLIGEDFKKAIHAYERLQKECDIDLCACHGLLHEEELLELKRSGVTRYHINIETSKRYFPYICTTHSYDEKIHTIQMAKKVGLKVCSGGIIGMGENWSDRMDMALELAELEVDSIPINILMPIKGTPFEQSEALTEDDIIRTIAIFRFLNPQKEIRLAAGRKYLKDNGREAFEAGANATITGNMLTTVGSNMLEDITMFHKMGFSI